MEEEELEELLLLLFSLLRLELLGEINEEDEFVFVFNGIGKWIEFVDKLIFNREEFQIGFIVESDCNDGEWNDGNKSNCNEYCGFEGG